MEAVYAATQREGNRLIWGYALEDPDDDDIACDKALKTLYTLPDEAFESIITELL